MIRKFLHRVFKKALPSRAEGHDPHIIPLKQHGIRPEHISPCALKVTEGLRHAGFKAFVVGGAVRDLLIGREPKDFDVATDAEPEQVRQLFRRSRIIGRRFRIVHVMCGSETIEVSTFRAMQASSDDDDHSTDQESGRILRDNVFGSQAEDAMRRDFTVNALYYEPHKMEIWDYCHGVADLKAGLLRVIGDPARRYREDPVRMLRAVRLSAKLGLNLDAASRKPIHTLAERLQGVPPARILVEMEKLLLSGHAVQSIEQLRKENLHHGLLPLLDVILEHPQGERFVMLALRRTDERVAQGKPVLPAYLFAALGWHEVLGAWKIFQDGGERPLPALNLAMDQVLDAQRETLAVPRRYDVIIKEIWNLQPRFAQRGGQRPYRLLENPRFRAGFDFLLMRCESGEIDAELGDWWTEFQNASDEERKVMLLPDDGPKKRRRRRKPKGPGGDAGSTQDSAS
ncbi:MAG: polynucleotide adenylyltransferase PcnB [Sulfuricella sp.]|nr:polynucleotide adenylyltransferase PcnB [Sulfuricella sp.]